MALTMNTQLRCGGMVSFYITNSILQNGLPFYADRRNFYDYLRGYATEQNIITSSRLFINL